VSKEDWFWMPHVAHLCVGNWCRFHLATYVNGHIISTVGEYLPDSDVRRCILEGNITRSFHSEEEKEKMRLVLSKIGDDFDRYYINLLGYEEIGCNRKYETMVFAAEKIDEECCRYYALIEFCIDSIGYNCPSEATRGHYAMCEKFDNVETIKRKYRKKPVVIEAYQWFPGMKTKDVIQPDFKDPKVIVSEGETLSPYIETLEGRYLVSPADYIITGIKGEKYPCKPDIFEETYNQVNDEFLA